jgi:hypothetical protein
MSITRREVTKTVIEMTDVTCDICGKTYTFDADKKHENDDWIETQEFHYISFRGGYGSIFGDGDTVTCDICQHCLKDKLGEYLKINEGDL